MRRRAVDLPALIAAYRGGASTHGLARQTGCSARTILGILRAAGVSIRPHGEAIRLAAARDPSIARRRSESALRRWNDPVFRLAHAERMRRAHAARVAAGTSAHAVLRGQRLTLALINAYGGRRYDVVTALAPDDTRDAAMSSALARTLPYGASCALAW